MQYSRLLSASICAAALVCAGPAFALGVHAGGGGGVHGGMGGGFHAGMSHGGGFNAGHGNFNAGFSRGAVGNGRTMAMGSNLHRGGFNHGGFNHGDWHHGGWHHGGGWYGGGLGYYGYPYGYDDAYDYPYDTDYAYDYPGYDYGYDYGYNYSPYAQTDQEAAVQQGNTCRTPVKMCQLYQPANVGADCSCRDGDTRAYGEVTP